ncbi:AraC-like DNA-binding protein [Aquimarina sp. MAR_2010_214]|uniref:helix-turn-helix domain-containing protein n=1 Tax=Aquimarina sp. MAR_2010_214 TaxID=1250026 RepID=UPI000C7132B1|nr:AraC family transcriptional regulator [Aquimarina sp. MAR_2010_214]PKV48196.1 AraC-like DNA-binding protein [Aquimarina sp. MAR_2010_214]
MDTLFIFYLALGIQSLIVALILLFYKSKKPKINRYLGFFFISLCIELLSFVLLWDMDELFKSYNPFTFNFLNMVFVFFYATETAGIEIKNKYRYYIPAILEFLVFSILLIKVIGNPDLAQSIEYVLFLYFDLLSSTIFIIYMCVRTILVVKDHNKFLPFFYTDVKYKSLVWLAVFCMIFIGYHLIAFGAVITSFEGEYIRFVLDGLALLLLYYFTIGSLIQINIVNITSESEVKLSRRKQEESKEVYERVSKEIERHMVDERAFLDQDLTLKTFAKRVGVSSRIISKTINEMKYKNFNMYLNHYRVEEFKALIESEKYQKYSNTALAKEAGFNSRASFYKNFKDIAGISPSDYFESLNSDII